MHLWKTGVSLDQVETTCAMVLAKAKDALGSDPQAPEGDIAICGVASRCSGARGHFAIDCNFSRASPDLARYAAQLRSTTKPRLSFFITAGYGCVSNQNEAGRRLLLITMVHANMSAAHGPTDLI